MKLSCAVIEEYMKEWPLGNDWYIDAGGEACPKWDICFDEYSEAKEKTAIVNTRTICAGIFHQGKDPTHGDGYELGSGIRRWLRDKKVEVLVVEIPKEAKDNLEYCIAQVGGRIIS